jgi:hypothetical protein
VRSLLKFFFRFLSLRLDPTQSNVILLSAVLPPDTIVIFLFYRIIFILIFIHATDALIQTLQPKIFTTQANLFHTVHTPFPLWSFLSFLYAQYYDLQISKKLSRTSPLSYFSRGKKSITGPLKPFFFIYLENIPLESSSILGSVPSKRL